MTSHAPGHDPETGRWTDEQVELVVGNLLRWGVLIAAAVAAVGAVIYLAGSGTAVADYRVFRGTAPALRSVSGILHGLASLDGRAVIQFGLLLLIATPVARVALSLFAFHKEGDRTYVVITAIVLALLLYSLMAG